MAAIAVSDPNTKRWPTETRHCAAIIDTSPANADDSTRPLIHHSFLFIHHDHHHHSYQYTTSHHLYLI